MKEFPFLQYHGAAASLVLAENLDNIPSRLFQAGEVLTLYNELRQAYLELKERNKQSDQLFARCGELELEVNSLRELLKLSRVLKPDSDPRLPGECRVPMEPGLYLARLNESASHPVIQVPGWHFIAEVYGQSPYLEKRRWNWAGVNVQPENWEAVSFGPRLAGPDWRQVTEKPLNDPDARTDSSFHGSL